MKKLNLILIFSIFSIKQILCSESHPITITRQLASSSHFCGSPVIKNFDPTPPSSPESPSSRCVETPPTPTEITRTHYEHVPILTDKLFEETRKKNPDFSRILHFMERKANLILQDNVTILHTLAKNPHATVIIDRLLNYSKIIALKHMRTISTKLNALDVATEHGLIENVKVLHMHGLDNEKAVEIATDSRLWDIAIILHSPKTANLLLELLRKQKKENEMLRSELVRLAPLSPIIHREPRSRSSSMES